MLIFHIDMNFVSLRLDTLKQWMDRLAALGYDTLLWEVEDKVQWQTCPECVWPEAMSKAEFSELLAYGRSLGFSHIPLLQTIGHAEYVLKHAPYHKWREDPAHHDCYCCCNPEVRRFLRQWISEYLELFGDIKAFHLGGDEAYRFATCPQCRARADKIGRNALYAEHIKELASDLIARGITPGIWGDMILAHPEQMDAVPKSFTIWDWNYWDGTGSPEQTQLWGHGMVRADEVNQATREALPALLDDNGRLQPFHSAHYLNSKGWDVILCGASRSGGDSFFIGRHAVHAPNLVGAAQTARGLKLAGMCVTSWAVRVHAWMTQLAWLEMAALAYRSPEQSLAQLEERVFPALLGLPGEDGSRLMQQLGCPLPFARMHENGVQFNRLKDPVAAPIGYVHSVVQRWQETEGELERQRNELSTSAEALAQAAATLYTLTGQGQGSPAFIESLSRALYCQIWASRFAHKILSVSPQARTLPDAVCAEAGTVGVVRLAMEAWARDWMTPQHAKLIAHLLFDRIEGFFAGEHIS